MDWRDRGLRGAKKEGVVRTVSPNRVVGVEWEDEVVAVEAEDEE